MGILLVISGPSGVGKSSVCNRLIQKFGNNSFLSISATERPIRTGESEGINYYFKSKQQFDEMIQQDKFLEWAKYGNYRYGTPKKPVFDRLNNSMNVVLEIEVQGAIQVKNNYQDAVSVFLLPPSTQDLINRLSARNTECEEEKRSRLERAKQEFDYFAKYDYIVINDELDKAVSQIQSIIEAENCKTTRARLDFNFNFEVNNND